MEILIPLGRRILITTKGTLYATRDLELIKKGNVAVTPTITTIHSSISYLLEPGAPSPEKRIEAAKIAADNDVPIGVRIDPIIPYVNDDPYDIEELVGQLADIGVRFIVTSTYKARPDNFARLLGSLGSDIANRLRKLYGNGEYVQGYRYLPKKLRINLLRPVIDSAKYYGLEYAVCREGLHGKEWFNAGSCDGTHLIPRRIQPRGLFQ